MILRQGSISQRGFTDVNSTSTKKEDVNKNTIRDIYLGKEEGKNGDEKRKEKINEGKKGSEREGIKGEKRGIKE